MLLSAVLSLLAAFQRGIPLPTLLLSSNGNNFPPPLSRAEEDSLFRRMREENDTEARGKLIEHNLRLVAHVVRKYYASARDEEDLVSIGTVGLIKSVDSFNPQNGARFATYAARCIENEILMLLRASRKRKGEVSLGDPVGTDGEGNAISFLDILGTEPGHVEDEAVRRVTMARVQRLVKALPSHTRS